MKFRRKLQIFSGRVTPGETVFTSTGLIQAYPGHWILTDSKGLNYVVEPGVFFNLYEPHDMEAFDSWIRVFGSVPKKLSFHQVSCRCDESFLLDCKIAGKIQFTCPKCGESNTFSLPLKVLEDTE